MNFLEIPKSTNFNYVKSIIKLINLDIKLPITHIYFIIFLYFHFIKM